MKSLGPRLFAEMTTLTISASIMTKVSPLSIFLLFIACFSLVFCTKKEYVAAVFEHQAFFIPYVNPPTREQALNVMMTNIKVYHEQASKAKSMKADIIVFPEDGLYGFIFNRETILPFLETIPQPSTLGKPWIPCLDPHRFQDTEILYQLSCIALNLSIAVVANMGDVIPCTTQDPNCPPDKRYQYNTDVAFDVDGTLIAKYHKQNLFRENQFNIPTKCEHVIFTTGFGVRFGMFTCFDMLFKSPALDLVIDYGIRNVVMPTAWMAGFPILLSVQYQQAWSRATCVNLLAANQHHPLANSMFGSGVYSCGEAKAYLFDPLATKDQRLMLATLPDLETTHWSGDRNVLSGPLTKSISVEKNIKNLEPQIFKAKVMNDIYNAVRIQSHEGTASVCQNQFCCSVDYKIANGLQDNYILASFSGHHNTEQYYLEVCVLFKCANQYQDSCGKTVETALTVFDYIHLSGNFTQTTHIFPELLVSGMKLVKKDALNVSGRTAMTTQGMKEPLISAVMLGRDYSRDKYP